LWKAPDEQTRELMEDFYRRILVGEPRAEATAAGAVGDEEEVSRSVLLPARSFVRVIRGRCLHGLE
jgi:hypothetical protein